MRQFIIRTLNLVLIIGVFIGYQHYASARAAVVAKHDAELKEAQALQDKYDKMVQEAEDAAAASGFQDGVYEGTGTGFGGDIKLKITIENHSITKAEVTSADSEDPEYLSEAEAILDEIVDQQTADLDTISGATFSSTGILQAASAALEEAQP